MSLFKERRTATHVYFVTGPGSQWFPSVYEQHLQPDGPLLTLNCGEQGMMAQKAWHFGDLAALDAIMAIQPSDMASVLLDMASRPVATLARFNEFPKAQKAAGRGVKPFDEASWAEAAPDYVFNMNVAKFSQNPAMRDWLLGTGDRILVEGSQKDRIWGVGLAWDDDRILDPSNWRNVKGAGHPGELGLVLTRVRAWLVRHADLFELLQDEAA